MGVDIHARRLALAQTHSQSNSLVLRFARVHSLVIMPVVFVRVVHPAAHFGAPLARFVAPEGAPPKTIFTIAAFTTAHGW
eukprot:8296561-Pyramimonas_sp.AAC.1